MGVSGLQWNPSDWNCKPKFAAKFGRVWIRERLPMKRLECILQMQFNCIAERMAQGLLYNIAEPIGIMQWSRSFMVVGSLFN